MGLLIRLAELLILLLPLTGAIVAVVRAFGARHQRRTGVESPQSDHSEVPADPTVAAVGSNPAAQWRTIRRVLDEHHRTDERWLDYELDVAKLLDFPLMTDMRHALTIAFHRAKLRADFLRPVNAEDLLGDRQATAQYMGAVEDYATAFNAAEAEAIRTRRNDFSGADQQRIARAQSLFRVAADRGAATHERQRAYDLACNELDGLVVLPSTTQANIEREVLGELDR